VRHLSLSVTAVLAVVALAAAGCGSSSTSSSTTNAAAPAAPGGGAGSSTAAASTATSAAAPTGGSAAVVATKHSKMGTILTAGGKHLTVYMFEGDKGATSSCTGACAHVWPPVTTGAAPTASGAAVAGDLGTITRSDGTMQVTYKGHPLYYFARDGDAGDAYGQGVVGFGASWYVLSPTGSKVDNS
jgi:predicted lipoprotein with Yx(FWY)xxD motif